MCQSAPLIELPRPQREQEKVGQNFKMYKAELGFCYEYFHIIGAAATTGDTKVILTALLRCRERFPTL